MRPTFLNSMHARKCGWVGQTFALAKTNESEGKKPRSRISKQERKALVESFIQKYQKSNNGSFPSLRLTHKEVGGSFYTVREIVRDIIQENRVLGPAKYPEENHSTHQLEQNPLGSIALEPSYPLMMFSSGSHLVQHEYLRSGEELNLASDGSHEHGTFDNGEVINSFLVDTEEKRLGEPLQGEVIEVEQSNDYLEDKEDDLISDVNLVSAETAMDNELTLNGSRTSHESHESHEMNQTKLQISEEPVVPWSEVTPTGDIEVETFPVRTGTAENDFGKNKVQRVELASGVGSPQTKLPHSSLVKELGITNEEVASTVKESPNNVFEQGNKVVGTKAVNVPNGMETKYVDRSGDTNGQLKTEKEVDVQHNGSSQKDSNPTLDRINLESWDGASKNPGRADSNPILVAFKSFINAFVKLWSS